MPNIKMLFNDVLPDTVVLEEDSDTVLARIVVDAGPRAAVDDWDGVLLVLDSLPVPNDMLHFGTTEMRVLDVQAEPHKMVPGPDPVMVQRVRVVISA